MTYFVRSLNFLEMYRFFDELTNTFIIFYEFIKQELLIFQKYVNMISKIVTICTNLKNKQTKL